MSEGVSGKLVMSLLLSSLAFRLSTFIWPAYTYALDSSSTLTILVAGMLSFVYQKSAAKIPKSHRLFLIFFASAFLVVATVPAQLGWHWPVSTLLVVIAVIAQAVSLLKSGQNKGIPHRK